MSEHNENSLNNSLLNDTELTCELMQEGVVAFPDFGELQMNPKDIIVVVDYHGEAFSKEESELLGNIYNALKLDRAQTNFLDIGKTQADFKTIVKTTQAKQFIFFGIHPETLRLNLDVQPYYLHKIEDKQLLFSYPLSDLLKEVKFKKHLWEAFKKMFNIQ